MTKVLIRNYGEEIFEPFLGVEWDNYGKPLTNPEWYGGAYAYCDNAPVDAIASDFDITDTEKEEVIEETYEEINEEGETETKTRTYTKVRRIRIATFNEEHYEARKQAENPDEVETVYEDGLQEAP